MLGSSWLLRDGYERWLLSRHSSINRNYDCGKFCTADRSRSRKVRGMSEQGDERHASVDIDDDGAGEGRSPKDPIYRIASVDNALRLLWMFRDQPVWTVSDAAD